MLLILPPSETKRDGGAEGSRVDLDALSFSSLRPQRVAVLSALSAQARSQRVGTGAVSLGKAQLAGQVRNRAVTTSPVLPAVERYTGVLYDGLDAASLTEAQRRFAADHVAIHSALFGLLGPDDPIPAYRLSHNSRLPGLSLGRHWRGAVTAELSSHDGLLIDARSEAYAALGPLPKRDNAVYLRVVTQQESGRRVALSHFNKKAKGEFARILVTSGVVLRSVGELIDWAQHAGVTLEPGASGELELVV